VRHAESGAVNLLSQKVNCTVINAGDGQHEHPTQALLDALTIRAAAGACRPAGGDLRRHHAQAGWRARTSTCCRSWAPAWRVVDPPTLMPTDIDKMGVEVHYNMRSGLKDVDIVMMLRLQTEADAGSFVPSISEYFRFFGLDTRSEIRQAGRADHASRPDEPRRRDRLRGGDDLDRSVIHEAGRDGRRRAHGLLEALIGGRRNAIGAAA